MEAALARGTDVVLRLDVQGAATVRRLIPDCVSIFLVRLRGSSCRFEDAVTSNPVPACCSLISLFVCSGKTGLERTPRLLPSLSAAEHDDVTS